MISELQSELEAVKAEHVSEKKKVRSLISSLSILKLSLTFAAGDWQASEEIKKLHAENAKLQYRITHLVRSLKEADSKLAP